MRVGVDRVLCGMRVGIIHTCVVVAVLVLAGGVDAARQLSGVVNGL